jgi:putative membrane protein
VIARWTIRIGTSLAGIAVGILISSAALSRFSLSVSALIEATLLFWIIHLVVQVVALRVLVREPSIALAGLLALASTIIALVIVNTIVSGLTIRGFETYVFATLIIWVTTSISDMIGHRMLKKRRQARRDSRHAGS